MQCREDSESPRAVPGSLRIEADYASAAPDLSFESEDRLDGNGPAAGDRSWRHRPVKGDPGDFRPPACGVECAADLRSAVVRVNAPGEGQQIAPASVRLKELYEFVDIGPESRFL